MIRVLHLIIRMDLKQGGPPEVIRNLKKRINNKNKIISVLPMDNLKYLMILKFIFSQKQDLKVF